MTDLSPQAQAVRDAALATYDKSIPKDVNLWALDRPSVVAALRAAAQQLPGVRWDGCIQPDAEHSLGINWSRDALHAIATELEGAN